jgi:nucleolar protein 53
MTLETGVKMGPPKINRRASRKLKGSWRKNIDMTEEESVLENDRFEERMGGSFAKRETKDLFIMDEQGTDNHQVPEKKEKKFKCWMNLEGLPGAPALRSKKHRTGPVKDKTNKITKAKREKKQFEEAKAEIASRAKVLEEKARIDESIHESKRTKFDFDLWDQEEKKDGNMENEWVTNETKVHTDLWSRKFKTKKVRNKKPLTLVPNVEVPHSGQSYNPTLEDHQDLLWKAAYVEIKKEKEERRLHMSLTAMFPNQEDAPTQKSYIQEMSACICELGGKVEESDNDEEASEEEEDEGYSKKEKQPKTTKQRRDKKLRLQAEEAAAKEKKERIEMAKIVSIKTYKKEFKARDKKEVERRARAIDIAIEKLKGPAKIGQYKFEPNQIEIKLSEELSGNLRKLKPEGSLLADRYKSLQKRRIIEPRVKVTRQKGLTKKVLIRHRKMGHEAEEAKIKNKLKMQHKKKAIMKGSRKRNAKITLF